MSKNDVRQIVTHPGAAHRDDFLAVCVALGVYGSVPVFRREPTPEELGDVGVLVLDCGGRWEPELRNFDHHQLGRSDEAATSAGLAQPKAAAEAAAECALSLLVRYLGMESEFELQPWWKTTKVLDAKGPHVAAAELGLEELPRELESPVEGALLSLFGDTSFAHPVAGLPECILSPMRLIGEALVASVRAYATCYFSVAEEVRVVNVKRVPCFVLEEVLSPTKSEALAAYRAAEHPEVGVSIARSDREGESWVLYRYDDDRRVDFSRLRGEVGVVFAHSVGFIAKLGVGVTLGEALEYVAEAASF